MTMNEIKVKKLESDIFDVIYELHINLNLKNKQQYRLCLLALDNLNIEYFQLTGKYYIERKRILEYYSKLWDNF